MNFKYNNVVSYHKKFCEKERRMFKVLGIKIGQPDSHNIEIIRLFCLFLSTKITTSRQRFQALSNFIEEPMLYIIIILNIGYESTTVHK